MGYGDILFAGREENSEVALNWWQQHISDDICDSICIVLHAIIPCLYMNHNPISKQASQLILDALIQQRYNPFSSTYSVDVTNEITLLNQVANEKRRRQGCDIKLEMKVRSLFKFFFFFTTNSILVIAIKEPLLVLN